MNGPAPRRAPLLAVYLTDALDAARSLWSTPRFTLPAFLSLVLGLGASIAAFAVFSAVALRPLPFPHDEELVEMRLVHASQPDGPGGSISYPYYDEQKRNDSLFASVSIWVESRITVTGMGDPRHTSGASVSPEFFDTLQVKPEIGRTFAASGPNPDGPDVVVLGHAFWKSALGGAADVVGRSIVLNGQPKTILGVVPDDPGLPAGRDMWTPIRLPDDMKTQRFACMLRSVARLKPGISPAVARERLQTITRAQNVIEDDGTQMYATLEPLRQVLLGEETVSAALMLSAVAAFLLLACANVAALLVTRASVRSRELAVRAALGAGPGELARHAGFEALALAIVSGGAGLGLGAWLVRLANRFYGSELAYAPARLDGRVLAGFLVLVLGATLLIGLAPTLHALRVRPMDSLRADGRSSASRGARRVREGLVAVQVAITLALLVSASVLVRSVRQLDAVVTGFDSSVVTAQVGLPSSRQDTVEKRLAFAREVTERVAHAPGVGTVAIAGDIPFDDDSMSLMTETGPGGIRTNVVADVHFIGQGYFQAMGIPLLAGRDFTREDTPDGAAVATRVIVSRAYGVQYFGTADVIGRHMSFGDTEGGKPDGAKVWCEIVGVVEDIIDEAVTRPVTPTIYVPFETPTNPRDLGFRIVARGPVDASVLVDVLAHVPRQVDLESTVWDVAPLHSMVQASYRDRTNLERLLGAFALASVVLAAIGLFGVTSYAVAERSGEIGIRRALGASRGDIILMILRETGVLVGAGMIAGVVCAVSTRKLLASFVYGVAANDPASYALVCAGVIVMAMLAALAPARAAASVTPTRALEVR